MTDVATRPFSWVWVGASVLAFITAELIIGGLVGEFLLARYTSISTGFLLQGLLNLAGYVVGGFAVGVLSPGRRLLEPAAGGFVTVVLTAIVAVFVPFRFIGFTGGGMLLAGVLAALIAGTGAYLGERLTGNG